MEQACGWCGKPLVEDERRIAADPMVSDQQMHIECAGRAEAGHIPPPVVRALAEAAKPSQWSFTASPVSIQQLKDFAEGRNRTWTDAEVQAAFLAEKRDKT